MEQLNKQELRSEIVIKAFGEESDTHYFFEGYGNVFNIRDSAGHITMPGAFGKSIQKHNASGIPLPITWNHNLGDPIGSWVEMYEDSYGLYIKGRLTKGVPQAETAYKLLKGGDVSGLSIGCYVIDKEMSNGSLLLNELDLFEIAIVTVPANYQSRITFVKSMLENDELPSISQVEKALREIGFSRSEAKILMSQGYKGLLNKSVEAEVSSEEEVIEIDSPEEVKEVPAVKEQEIEASETPVETDQTEQEQPSEVEQQETESPEDINTNEIDEEAVKALNEIAALLKSFKV